MASEFSELRIRNDIKDALKATGFTTMTPVQAAAIPALLAQKDVIVQSQTGSGKTLAYLVPLLSGISADAGHTLALIVVPTRELCMQIQETIAPFGTACACFIGGSPIEDDAPRLGAPICIATPGRLLELMLQDAKPFQRIKFLILDESDKLLDSGFESKLLKIISFLPKARATGLFSATISDAVTRLSQHSLRNPQMIKISEDMPSRLHLRYVLLDPQQKLGMLMRMAENKRCIVFFATCAQVDFFYGLFKSYYKECADLDSKESPTVNGVEEHNTENYWDDADEQALGPENTAGGAPRSTARSRDGAAGMELKEFNNGGMAPGCKAACVQRMHGKMEQNERNLIYSRFEKDGGFLFCTDVAARGIDFKGIDLVLHFDVPKDPANIVHRSGRTARNGSEGESVLFLMKNEAAYVEFLKLKDIGIQEYSGEQACDATDALRRHVDADMLAQAVRAFVSYFRSYKEHVINYILCYKELDFDGLARLFFLQKIPSMPELRKVKFAGFARPSESAARGMAGRAERKSPLKGRNAKSMLANDKPVDRRERQSVKSKLLEKKNHKRAGRKMRK